MAEATTRTTTTTSNTNTTPNIIIHNNHYGKDTHSCDDESLMVSLSPSNRGIDMTHKTTEFQTYLALIKGYVGPGCLSLPWAMSQMGIFWGVVGCFALCYWTSYICILLLQIKRDIAPFFPSAYQQHITYPDISGHVIGKKFASLTRACICIQQLAVCTVFVSFVGENIYAVVQRIIPDLGINHVLVTTLAMPAIIALCLLPDIKALAPVIKHATITLFIGFFWLFVLAAVTTWEDDSSSTNDNDDNAQNDQFNNNNNYSQELQSQQRSVFMTWPLAICAILYSYEGICLILPIEAAMATPNKFDCIFWTSVWIVSVIFAIVAAVCVLSFGNVTNGSITAFLLEEQDEDDNHYEWIILLSNTAVSISVILTYPLQIYPCLELVGPMVYKWRHSQFSLMVPQSNNDCNYDNDDNNNIYNNNNIDDHDTTPVIVPSGSCEMPRTGDFQPVPSPVNNESDYNINKNIDNIRRGNDDTTDETDGLESQSLEQVPFDEEVEEIRPESDQVDTFLGDSISVRIGLVSCTYFIAVLVPNVQVLISLGGALAGSSVALLIPPILLWYHDKNSKVKSIGLFLLGLLFSCIGTGASIRDIVQMYSK